MTGFGCFHLGMTGVGVVVGGQRRVYDLRLHDPRLLLTRPAAAVGLGLAGGYLREHGRRAHAAE